MEKNSLSFHLSHANHKLMSYEERDRYSQEFIKSLGLKVNSGCWSTIDLDSPVIHEFIEAAGKRIESGEAIFYGFNMLLQELVETAENSYEWYILEPDKSIDIKWEKNIIFCNAYKMPGNINVAHGSYYNPFVSEKFVEVCNKNGLTGIEFLWCIDKGKYQARQWYEPIALYPFGRGIDHPWFKPETMKGSGSYQPTNSLFRMGIWRFANTQIKNGAEFENEIFKDILSLFQPGDLTVISYRRYLRDYLPSTDFAYVWRQEDDNEKYSLRDRKLCLNRRAMECLLHAGVIKSTEVKPVRIYDEVPAGSLRLDGPREMPCPIYTREELVEIRKVVDEKWAGHLKTEKPMRKVSMKEAMKMLRQARKERPHDFKKGMRKDKLADLNSDLPEMWREILSLANGCILDADCELLPIEKIDEFNRKKQAYVQSLEEDYPLRYVAVGFGADGDWFALDQSEPFESDCKVFRISHEDLSIFDSWDSIPFFVSEILSGYYE